MTTDDAGFEGRDVLLGKEGKRLRSSRQLLYVRSPDRLRPVNDAFVASGSKARPLPGRSPHTCTHGFRTTPSGVCRRGLRPRRVQPCHAGPFTQADIHPDGTAAVFWGGFDARPRVWLYDFATKSARPLTADNVGSLEPSFDWQGRRIVFAADTVYCQPC